jgi:hypothetical protein
MNLPVGLVAGAVLGAHGTGHVLGWLPAWGLASFQQVSRKSWALDPLVGQRISEAVAGALYLVPTIGFLAAAIALATGQPWWREVAVLSAIGSLVASALFPTALPPSSLVGATAVNLVVLGLAAWGEPVLAQLVRH